MTARIILAITAEFISRKFYSASKLLVIICVIAILASVWLTTVSAWWWLVAAPVLGLALLIGAAWLLVRIVIRNLATTLIGTQQRTISEFVDDLEQATEALQTPVPIVVIKLLLDLVRVRRGLATTYLGTLISDSISLRDGFRKLQQSWPN